MSEALAETVGQEEGTTLPAPVRPCVLVIFGAFRRSDASFAGPLIV